MNLTIVDIVKAHGKRVANACSDAHERLMSMDQNRIVMDEQTFIDSIINDEEIDIPISVVEEEITVGNIAAAIAERITEAEENLKIVQDGRTYTDEEWFLLSCWKIELARRGEANPITMGARPIALRTLALLQAERKLQDIPNHEVNVEPRPRWADALRTIRDEAEMAQAFITEVVPNITQTSMKGDSTTHQFVTPEAIEGHPRDVMLEFAPGQIIAVLTIILSYDDKTQEADVAVIDDNCLMMDQVMPETLLSASIGKPLETIFDHEIVRGLGLIIDGYKLEDEQVTITFQAPNATPLIMRDAPTNWCEEETMEFD